MDPELLHSAIKHGVAPAMKANPDGTFWGGTLPEDYKLKKNKTLCGHIEKWRLPHVVKMYAMRYDKTVAAREVIQAFTRNVDNEKLPLPDARPDDEEMPQEPNVYTNGSLKNGKVVNCQIGGFGVWWPGRRGDVVPRSKNETKFMHAEQEEEGLMQWGLLNSLRNSSARCEIGAIMMAMLADKVVHIASDSMAAIRKANDIIKHIDLRRKTKLVTEECQQLLGGKTSFLPGKSPYKKGWAITKDGSLWQAFAEAVGA